MAVKPTVDITWLPSVPYNDTTEFIVPSSGKRNAGWNSAEKPAFQYFNFFFKAYSDWRTYFETFTDEIAAINVTQQGQINSNATSIGTLNTTTATHTSQIAALVVVDNSLQAQITALPAAGVTGRGTLAVAGGFTAIDAGNDAKVFECDTAAALAASTFIILTLPASIGSLAGKKWTIIDKTGAAERLDDAYGFQISTNGNVLSIAGRSASQVYPLNKNYGAWTLYCDGSGFYFI